MKSNRWLLPEGIDEVLPQQAWQLELMRRQLIDLYQSWGYDLVMPPFIEYLDSLLVANGHDLELQTFTLTDQLSGRQLGIRADMTPQVARIDAHHLAGNAPARLCYLGTVLHSRPDGFAGSRSLLQVGAELYGHTGIDSDIEVIRLMLETLSVTNIENIHLDLGHVGVYRSLVQQAGLSSEQEKTFNDVMQRKAKPELQQLLAECSLDERHTQMLTALVDLHGGHEVLQQAATKLTAADEHVKHALADLEKIAVELKNQMPSLNIHFDLAELRGYNYHTGVVFEVYVPGKGKAIAQGGRYDGIGAEFGESRPATGFSTDLRTLLALNNQNDKDKDSIFAPCNVKGEAALALTESIKQLRQAGERVIACLAGQESTASDMNCKRQLVQSEKGWQVIPV
jgi:ATP phosphoribosyltransferase regulatory subunit